MDDLMTHLRAAAESPPPTSIDLDSLINDEVRRRRTHRIAGAGAAFAAVAALAIAVPTLLGGGANALPDRPATTGRAGGCPTAGAPGPQQSHAKPRPTESCADAIARLETELTAALRKVAPGTLAGPVEFVYVPVRLRYETTVTLTSARGEDRLRVELIASHERPDDAAGCRGPDCSLAKDSDGTITVTQRQERQHQVVVHRPDGTAVLLLVTSASTADDARPTLSGGQVEAIARTPGLTLFPETAAPEPSAEPTPDPQDPAAAALTEGMTDGFAELMPGAKLADPNAPAGSPVPRFTGSRESGYKAAVDVTDGRGLSHLQATYIVQRAPCAQPPMCERPPECPYADATSRCEVQPDGTRAWMSWSDSSGMIHREAQLYRPDGSIITLDMTNFGPYPTVDPAAYKYGVGISCVDDKCVADPPVQITRDTPPLTVEQLVDLGNGLRF